MTHRILLVEDSKEIHQMVTQALGGTVEIDWADSIKAAETAVNSNQYSMVLLDIELPDGNGIEFCGQLQSTLPNLPVFFLTSHDQLSEKVLGFSAGADDYIAKPFNSFELKARVEAKLKKLDMTKKSSDVLKWKELTICHSKQEVQVFNGDNFEPVELTALEFKLLTYFAARPQIVIPRDEILDAIWGKDVHIYSRSVDTHVSKLRKKLGPASDVIESIRGSGYKFIPSK